MMNVKRCIVILAGYLLFSSHSDSRAVAVPAGLKKLLAAYPGMFKGATQNSIIWNDGTSMVFDDGVQNKSFQALLDNADLEDQVNAMPYPRNGFTEPKKNNDPGRVRYEPFFLKMYGSTEQQVRANLVEITWLPKNLNQKLKVSKVNGVADKLAKISAELDQDPELTKYLKNPGGTFIWRKINGTNRLSTHSFGITIDINITYSNYWQWDNKDWKKYGENMDVAYKNRIPLKIVQIFEKYGFIWGGKWYHYDTMHFEYRPELL
jgi:hypothetical protein